MCIRDSFFVEFNYIAADSLCFLRILHKYCCLLYTSAWRFPGLAAKYGGGAFLLIYVLAMIVLGFPLLTMELAIGRKMRSGAPGARCV